MLINEGQIGLLIPFVNYLKKIQVSYGKSEIVANVCPFVNHVLKCQDI